METNPNVWMILDALVLQKLGSAGSNSSQDFILNFAIDPFALSQSPRFSRGHPRIILHLYHFLCLDDGQEGEEGQRLR